MGGLDGLGGRAGGQETTSGDWDRLGGRFSSRCQGEGRGFESRRPLHMKVQLSGVCRSARRSGLHVAHHAHQLPINSASSEGRADVKLGSERLNPSTQRRFVGTARLHRHRSRDRPSPLPIHDRARQPRRRRARARGDGRRGRANRSRRATSPSRAARGLVRDRLAGGRRPPFARPARCSTATSTHTSATNASARSRPR